MTKAESKAEQQRPTDDRVAKLIEEQKRSGMSLAAFARKHGIPPWKLYQAGRRRSRRRAEFVEVAVSSNKPDSSPIELILPGDVRVRVPRDFDEPTLRRLLGALTSC